MPSDRTTASHSESPIISLTETAEVKMSAGLEDFLGDLFPNTFPRQASSEVGGSASRRDEPSAPRALNADACSRPIAPAPDDDGLQTVRDAGGHIAGF